MRSAVMAITPCCFFKRALPGNEKGGHADRLSLDVY